jgi:threonine/homoserine/homoserine lactone efflux protein
MINELITALMLGLIGGMIPGPVITAVFTEILQSNFYKSLRIIFIAMFTETLVALFSLIFFISLDFSEAFFRGISFVGATILILIGISIWKVKTIDSGQKVDFSFWKISTMILANGILWSFWITICIPKAIFLGNQLLFGEYFFLGLVEIGWLFSTTLLAYIFSRFRQLLSKPKIVPVIFKLFAIVFFYFAIDMTYNSIVFFR